MTSERVESRQWQWSWAMGSSAQLEVGSDCDQLAQRVLAERPVGDLLPVGEAAREGVVGEAHQLVLLLLAERRVVPDSEYLVERRIRLLRPVVAPIPDLDVMVVE